MNLSQQCISKWLASKTNRYMLLGLTGGLALIFGCIAVFNRPAPAGTRGTFWILVSLFGLSYSINEFGDNFVSNQELKKKKNYIGRCARLHHSLKSVSERGYGPIAALPVFLGAFLLFQSLKGLTGNLLAIEAGVWAVAGVYFCLIPYARMLSSSRIMFQFILFAIFSFLIELSILCPAPAPRKEMYCYQLLFALDLLIPVLIASYTGCSNCKRIFAKSIIAEKTVSTEVQRPGSGEVKEVRTTLQVVGCCFCGAAVSSHNKREDTWCPPSPPPKRPDQTDSEYRAERYMHYGWWFVYVLVKLSIRAVSRERRRLIPRL